jgi:hypothetical protein
MHGMISIKYKYSYDCYVLAYFLLNVRNTTGMTLLKASRHSSGPQNFEVAPKLFGKILRWLPNYLEKF